MAAALPTFEAQFVEMPRRGKLALILQDKFRACPLLATQFIIYELCQLCMNVYSNCSSVLRYSKHFVV